MDPLPELPLMLYPSRGKMMLFLCVCLLAVAGSVLMVRHGDRVGYLCGGIFALCIPIFLISMSHKAAYLRLHGEGFTYSSLYRTHTVPWADVLEFGVMRTSAKSMVGWNYVPGYTKFRRMRGVNQAIAGFDAALPDNYGMDTKQLAALMAVLAAAHGPAPAEQGGEFKPEFARPQPVAPADGNS